MVDRIKFVVDNAVISEEILRKKFFEAITNKRTGSKTYLYKNNFSYEDEEESEEDVLEPKKYTYDKAFKKHLYIKYVVYKTPKKLPNNDYLIKSELIIHRNIRKDRFGEGKTADLRFINFLKIIEKFIWEFNLDEKSVWNSRVTKLELGATIKLSSKMRGILSCFDSFKDLTEKNIYGDNGIAFIGENFSVSIYDKLKKMEKNEELFKSSKNKKKLIEKVSKNNYFLRFEVKIEKVSGFNRHSFKGKINRLKDIRDNWNYLGTALFDMYNDISYIDILSPEVEDSIAGKERKPMNDFLKFKGMQAIGKDRFFNQILPLMKNYKGSLSKFRSEYRNFFNDYERKFRVDYEYQFTSKLEDRIESLRKR